MGIREIVAEGFHTDEDGDTLRVSYDTDGDLLITVISEDQANVVQLTGEDIVDFASFISKIAMFHLHHHLDEETDE